MKMVQVSSHSKMLYALLQQARSGNLILRTEDGVEFILAELHDFNREIELARENKELMAFLEERGRASNMVSSAEARRRLGLDDE